MTVIETLERILLKHDPQIAYTFFRKHDAPPEAATYLMQVCTRMLTGSPCGSNSVDSNHFIFDFCMELPKYNDRIIQFFCLLYPCIGPLLMICTIQCDVSRLVNSSGAQVIPPTPSPSRDDVYHYKHKTWTLAQRLYPTLLEVELELRAGGIVISRGKYEPAVFASIMLGAIGAPIEIVREAVEHTRNRLFAQHAFNALCASPCAKEVLIAEYRELMSDYQVVRPLRPVAAKPHKVQSVQKREDTEQIDTAAQIIMSMGVRGCDVPGSSPSWEDKSLLSGSL